MEEFYLDHRSRPLSGTKYWQCVIWLVADETRLNLVEYVRYFLHPSFHSEFTESKDISTNFRTILDCWGSFYIKASIFFKTGQREDIDYFLDHQQFFPRKRKPILKMLTDKDIDEKEFLKNIDNGVRFFRNINITETSHQELIGKSLKGIKCEKTQFQTICFRGVDLSGSLFTDCNFFECDFSLAKSEQSQYTNCDFSESILDPKLFLSSKINNIKASQIKSTDKPTILIPNDRLFGEMEFENWINDLQQRINDIKLIGSSPKVFLCHANEDKERIEMLYSALKNYGVTPWFDKTNLSIGDIWKSKIKQAIKDTDFFAVCLSKVAIEKKGFIHNEIHSAIAEYQNRPYGTVFLLPIRLEDCKIPCIELDANTTLTDLHWIDIFHNDKKAEKRLADSIWSQWKEIN